MKLLFIISTILLPILVSASQMQSRELPNKDMKSQNKKIASLAANEMSKSLPQVIDKYTKLVNIKAQDTTLIYIFEIDTTPKSDQSIIDEDHSRMKEAVTLGTCQTSQRFLEADIAIRYIYKSANTKTELFQFNINQESCLKL